MISNACFAPFLIALSVAMILVVSYVIIRLTIFLTLMPILLIFVFFVILFIATCAQICKNALSVKNLITISSILQGRLQLINVLNVTFLNASCARVWQLAPPATRPISSFSTPTPQPSSTSACPVPFPSAPNAPISQTAYFATAALVTSTTLASLASPTCACRVYWASA
mgnify:CR=1 FL=1